MVRRERNVQESLSWACDRFAGDGFARIDKENEIEDGGYLEARVLHGPPAPVFLDGNFTGLICKNQANGEM